MASPNRQSQPESRRTEQSVLNKSFDEKYQVLSVAGLVYDPATDTYVSGRQVGTYATKILDDSLDTNISYLGKAVIGSTAGNAVWQIQKLDETGGGNDLIITWADGDSNFDNVWTNRESLTYT